MLSVFISLITIRSFSFFKEPTKTVLSFQINEVDRGLLKFTNLQELSLTGNCLTSVVGAHLPKSLAVIVNTIQALFIIHSHYLQTSFLYDIEEPTKKFC